MNSLLMKHRPKDTTKDKWTEQWENLGPSLQPLYDALCEMKQGLETIKPTDFQDANHYAKLVSVLTEKQTIERIIDLLPKSVKKVA